MKRDPTIRENYLKQGFDLQTTYRTHMTQHHDKQSNFYKMGKGPEQTLLQGGHTEGPETYERVLKVTTIREMHIKTTMRYHLTSVRNGLN